VNLLRVYAIGMLYAKWMLKNKIFYVYLTLFLPFSILVPFYLIASEYNRSFIAIGTLIFTLLSNSMVTACQDLAVDKLLKRIEVLLSKPITSIEYFLGQILSNAIQTFPATLIMIITLYILNILSIANILLFLIGLILGWYTATAIGFTIAIALSSKDYNTIVIISNVISFILVFLAPIYYPPSYIPELFRYIALVLPSTHIANIIGVSCRVSYNIDLLISVVYLLALAIISTMVIAMKIRLKDIY